MILKTDNSLSKSIRRKLQLLIDVNNWAFEHIFTYDSLKEFDHAVLIKFGRVPPSIIETLWRNRPALAKDGIWLQQSKTKGRTMQRAMEPGCLWIPTVGVVHLSIIREPILWEKFQYVLIRKEGNQFKFSFEETRVDFEEQPDNDNVLQRLYSVEQRLSQLEGCYQKIQANDKEFAELKTLITDDRK